MKKAILILANNDAGLYKFRKELIGSILDKGYKVFISVPEGDLIPPLVKKGCVFLDTSVDRRGMNPVTDMKLLLRYVRLIRQIQPDLVITYTIKPNIYGGLACRLLRVRYAMNITGLGTAFEKGGWVQRLVTILYKTAGREAQKVFFENKRNLLLFKMLRIVRRSQAVLLHGAGVNMTEFALKEYPSEEEGIRFLFIGRIMKEKGVDELFAAASEIKKRYSNTFFDVVGPYEDDYINVVEELQKQGIIHHYGYQEDVRPFIARAHCFVLPSYHEGMANTLLEAGAMGRPLITNDIPGCREAVVDGKTGILCEEKSIESLENALVQFIEFSRDERKSMALSSYKYIKKNFERMSVVEKTMKELGISY